MGKYRPKEVIPFKRIVNQMGVLDHTVELLSFQTNGCNFLICGPISKIKKKQFVQNFEGNSFVLVF